VTLSRDVIFSYSPTVPASPNPLFRPSRTGRDVAVPWPAKSIVQSDTTCTVYAVPHYDHTTPLTGEFASALFSSSASPGTVTGDGIQFNSINSSTSHFRTLHQFSSFPTLSLLTLHFTLIKRLDSPTLLLSTLNSPRGTCFALDQEGLLAGSVPKPKPSPARTHSHLCVYLHLDPLTNPIGPCPPLHGARRITSCECIVLANAEIGVATPFCHSAQRVIPSDLHDESVVRPDPDLGLMRCADQSVKPRSDHHLHIIHRPT
jgi:hypothetical protein